MTRRWIVVLLMAGIVPPVVAQERRPAPSPSIERARERAKTTSPEMMSGFYYFNTGRGKLGITVSIVPQPRTDSLGALVEAITPGGPAFKVGLRSGDIITRFNGRLVSQTARERRLPSPGMVLVETSTNLNVGDTARIEYLRNTSRRTVSVVLEPMPEVVTLQGDMLFPTPVPDGTWRTEPDIGLVGPAGQPGDRVGTLYMPLRATATLELAPMNPGLGQYFGVSSGVLVISVPEGSDLNLRNGDVVTTVDGRGVSSPNQFFRILRTYDPGEPIKFGIVRMKRTNVVTGTLSR